MSFALHCFTLHFYIRGTKNENFSDLFIPMTFFHLKELTFIKRVQTVTYIKVIYIFSFVENSFFFEYNRFSYNLELHLFFLHWKKNILNRGHLEKLTLHNFRWIYVMISVWPMDSYFWWLMTWIKGWNVQYQNEIESKSVIQLVIFDLMSNYKFNFFLYFCLQFPATPLTLRRRTTSLPCLAILSYSIVKSTFQMTKLYLMLFSGGERYAFP